ncbi:MAG: non-homologous end-joining DNA ligase [Pseudomonadota bacterium]
MTLKVYNAKRDFKKTPEPSGKTLRKKTTHNLFVIQKHAASHLHYDFRLELNGVLLSWAVPKGPCLDPDVKRLAMHVEDHPVKYGSFEGIIPKGQYGGGTVMLWDKGKWFCEEENPAQAYKNGKLTFTLEAEKLHGRWKLFRINKDDKTWLLMKAKDDYAKPLKKYDVTVAEPDSVLTQQSIDEITNNYTKRWGKKGAVKVARPKAAAKAKSPVKKNALNKLDLPVAKFPNKVFPELATLVSEPPADKNWVHEIKYDGYRLVVMQKNKSIALMTRNNNNWTHKFKEVQTAVAKQKFKNIILDGEIVVLDNKAKSDFQLLQNTIKEGGHPFVFYIFDILYYDQYDLTSLPLIERKALLEQLLPADKKGMLRYSEHIVGDGHKVFKHACKLGLEGIISKEANSPYQQKRTDQWVKTKCIKRQEFVIGGIMAPRPGKRKLIRSLMLGTFNKKKELVYNGNVGTGFTEASIKEIYALLKKYKTDKMPFAKLPAGSKNAVWLKPVVVAEVEFTEWTDDNSLRHPSFKGIRKDKPAKAITKEKVANLSFPRRRESISRKPSRQR